MNYRDLRIYQIAKKLQNELYKELIRIPRYWQIPEVDQAIRSSSSATSNIVEGYGRKYYPKEFYRFLDFSMSSSDETQNHVEELFEKKLMQSGMSEYFQINYKYLAIKTLNFMNKIKKDYLNL